MFFNLITRKTEDSSWHNYKTGRYQENKVCTDTTMAACFKRKFANFDLKLTYEALVLGQPFILCLKLLRRCIWHLSRSLGGTQP